MLVLCIRNLVSRSQVLYAERTFASCSLSAQKSWEEYDNFKRKENIKRKGKEENTKKDGER